MAIRRVVIVLFVVCNVFVVHGQGRFISRFMPVDQLPDTLSLNGSLDSLDAEFIAANEFGAIYRMAFPDRVENAWYMVVWQDQLVLGFDLMFDDNAHNSVTFTSFSDNGLYAFFKASSSGIARETEYRMSYLFIVDLLHKSSNSIETENFAHYWGTLEEDGEPTDLLSFEKSSVLIEGDYITLLDNCYDPSDQLGVFCFSGSGKYTLGDEKITKIASYDDHTMMFHPVVYFGELALNMSVAEVMDNTPLYNRADVAPKEYGFDEMAEGWELSRNGVAEIFLVINWEQNTVQKAALLAPGIEVLGVEVGDGLADVVRIFADAIPILDPYTKKESIYIASATMELLLDAPNGQRLMDCWDQKNTCWNVKELNRSSLRIQRINLGK